MGFKLRISEIDSPILTNENMKNDHDLSQELSKEKWKNNPESLSYIRSIQKSNHFALATRSIIPESFIRIHSVVHKICCQM